LVKYAQAEWNRKHVFLPEEKILINPLDPVYKKLLKPDSYDQNDILTEVESRLNGEVTLYNPPENEALYQLFPLVSVAKKGSHSREASLVISMIIASIKERVWYALDNPVIELDILDTMQEITTVKKMGQVPIDIPKEDVFRLVSGTDHLQYVVHWTDLAENDLTKYYIRNGWVPLTRQQLIEVYALLLTKALKSYIDEKREEYKTQNLTLPPIFSKLFQKISSKVPAVSVKPVGATELDENAFPPCVRESLQGVSSGLRNYAITVLLTSFLSYARVYPSPKAFDQDTKPQLSPEQIEILLDEIIPLIMDAGSRCDPPLFTDQPIERLNIFYHLGFGLNESASPSDFGVSKWYLPPSCQKIKQNAPSLCKPDILCLEGLYIVVDRNKLEQLINANTGKPQKILIALRKTRNPRKVADQTGADIGEVKRIFRNLQKEDILIQIKIKNPLMYYIRKIRKKKKRNKKDNKDKK
jgi:DNA primase large subunit